MTIPLRPDQEMAFVFSNIQTGTGLSSPNSYITLDVVLFHLLQSKSIFEFIKSKKINPTAQIDELEEHLNTESRKSASVQGESREFSQMMIHLFSTLNDQERKEFGVFDMLFELTLAAHRDPDTLIFNIINQLNLDSMEIKAMADKAAATRNQDEGGMENWIIPMGMSNEPWVATDELLSSLAQGLARRKKHHVLLVGDSGVGKTALLEGVSRLIKNNKAPNGLHNLQMFSLDWAAVVSGAHFRGDVEKRFRLIEEHLADLGAGSTLVLDDLHHFINMGAQGQMDPVGLLLPIMRRGRVRVIASLTPDRLNQMMEKMPGFLSQFQKVEINEPSIEQSLKIAHAWTSDYQNHHSVRFSDEVILRASDLVKRHIPSRRFPEKLLDVLDEAGARVRHETPSNRLRPAVSIIDVEQVVSKMARLPLAQLAANDVEVMRHLNVRLKDKVFGQDEAIEALTSSIRRSRAGLGRGGIKKPMGVFLFAGPTGVGKTEIAKQLAETMAMPLVRFDMSEYSEPHTVSKLIGAPPGYVGYQDGGQLASAVTKTPCSIVLLDEFEKAHPSLHNIFLQVMDDGFLTDGNGRRVDFRQTILILTSNIGSFEAKSRSIGFHQEANQSENQRKSAIDKFMSPEFRNRIDRQVIFNSISEEIMVSIVDRQLAEFKVQAFEKNVDLDFDISLKSYLVKEGYSPEFGARPLLRLIEENIQTKLAEEMLFGRLIGGGKVNLSMNDDELIFNWPLPVHSKMMMNDEPKEGKQNL